MDEYKVNEPIDDDDERAGGKELEALLMSRFRSASERPEVRTLGEQAGDLARRAVQELSAFDYEPDTIEYFALRRMAYETLRDIEAVLDDEARSNISPVNELLTRFFCEYFDICNVNHPYYPHLCLHLPRGKLAGEFLRRLRERSRFP